MRDAMRRWFMAIAISLILGGCDDAVVPLSPSSTVGVEQATGSVAGRSKTEPVATPPQPVPVSGTLRNVDNVAVVSSDSGERIIIVAYLNEFSDILRQHPLACTVSRTLDLSVPALCGRELQVDALTNYTCDAVPRAADINAHWLLTDYTEDPPRGQFFYTGPGGWPVVPCGGVTRDAPTRPPPPPNPCEDVFSSDHQLSVTAKRIDAGYSAHTGGHWTLDLYAGFSGDERHWHKDGDDADPECGETKWLSVGYQHAGHEACLWTLVEHGPGLDTEIVVLDRCGA